MKIRIFRQTPFAWQSKEVFRLIRKVVPVRERTGVRSTYVALTEIASDRADNEMDIFLKDLEHYTSMDRKTISQHLKVMQNIGIIRISPRGRTAQGRYSVMTILLADIDPTLEVKRGRLTGNDYPYIEDNEDNIYYEKEKTDKNEEETEDKKRTRATSKPISISDVESATLTVPQLSLYQILSARSARPVPIDDFKINYEYWLKEAGSADLLRMATACVSWYTERKGKFPYPISDFSAWINNATSKNHSTNNDVTVQNKADSSWETTADFDKLDSEQKRYLIDAIKGGPPLYGPGWSPPLNTPTEYVNMFYSRDENTVKDVPGGDDDSDQIILESVSATG